MFSKRTSDFITNCWWRPSQDVYEAHWQKVFKYCERKHWNVFAVRSQHHPHYAMHMSDEGHQPTTIISHRTSIASLLKDWCYNILIDHPIRIFFCSFQLAHLVKRHPMPKWILFIMLFVLLHPPPVSKGDRLTDDIIESKRQSWRVYFCFCWPQHNIDLSWMLSVGPNHIVALQWGQSRTSGWLVYCQDRSSLTRTGPCHKFCSWFCYPRSNISSQMNQNGYCVQ